MNSKKKKYIYLSQIRKVFLEHSKDIALFVHINHMNVFEFNNLKAYCLKNGIHQASWKLNLLKKITKNNIFLSLLKGPTRIFFFQSLTSMLDFVEFFSIKKKIIPLAIYWKIHFYNYSFFVQYIKQFSSLLQLDSANFAQLQLVSSLNNTKTNLIYSFHQHFFNVLNMLEAIKNIKQKNNN